MNSELEKIRKQYKKLMVKIGVDNISEAIEAGLESIGGMPAEDIAGVLDHAFLHLRSKYSDELGFEEPNCETDIAIASFANDGDDIGDEIGGIVDTDVDTPDDDDDSDTE